MGKKSFEKVHIQQKYLEVAYMVASWALSLKFSQKEALKKLLLFEDNSDLKSPTSNHIPDIHLAISFAYDTFKNFFFLRNACLYCLILHF